MKSTIVAICCLAAGISIPTADVWGEDAGPNTLELRMIGDRGRVYNVQLKSHVSKGMMFTRVGKKGRWSSGHGFATYWTKPVCIDHSKEVGQLAIVRYLLGGGTGVSVSRYVILRGHDGAIECIGHGRDDCYEWSRASVSQSYRIRTAFEGADDGLIRRVSISVPKDDRMQQSVEVAGYTVHYEVSRKSGEFALRPRVDRRHVRQKSSAIFLNAEGAWPT